MHLKQKAILLLAALLAGCGNARDIKSPVSTQCHFDRSAMLALDENHFDQDTENGEWGWRSVASKPHCELAAADLIAEYRTKRASSSPLLFWHEGQLRAFSGQYERAIELFKKSYKPKAQDFGWNAYADATIAFLSKDREGLSKALTDLRATPAPDGETLKNGKLDMTFPDGTKAEMPWPLNVDVVEGLQRCFNRTYREAYSSKCREKN